MQSLWKIFQKMDPPYIFRGGYVKKNFWKNFIFITMIEETELSEKIGYLLSELLPDELPEFGVSVFRKETSKKTIYGSYLTEGEYYVYILVEDGDEKIFDTHPTLFSDMENIVKSVFRSMDLRVRVWVKLHIVK